MVRLRNALIGRWSVVVPLLARLMYFGIGKGEMIHCEGITRCLSIQNDSHAPPALHNSRESPGQDLDPCCRYTLDSDDPRHPKAWQNNRPAKGIESRPHRI